MLEGRLELWVGDERHILEEGDTVTLLVATAAPQPEPRRGAGGVLFCITPPSF